MAFNPLQLARRLWDRAFSDAVSTTEAQPLFLCPSCGFRRQPPSPGQTFCSECAGESKVSRHRNSADGEPSNTAKDSVCTIEAGAALGDPVLPRARQRLKEGIRDRSITLVSTKAELQTHMRTFWLDLPLEDQQTVATELFDLGFRDTNTFKALTGWAYARLRVRLAEKTDIALNGPPIRIVGGGLPGLGK